MHKPKTPAFAIDDKGGDSRRDDPPRADDPDVVEARNARRMEMIDRKYLGGGISPQEQEELDTLQSEFERRRDELFPPPTAMLDALEKLADELEAEGQAT